MIYTEVLTKEEIGSARRKCADQRNRAKKRGIAFKFTFQEWIQWWIDSGYWFERGPLMHQYCMSRYGDKGDYEPNNVFAQTNLENCKQANLGRKHSDEVNAKKGSPGLLNGFYGKTHTAETLAKIHTPENHAKALKNRKENRIKRKLLMQKSGS